MTESLAATPRLDRDGKVAVLSLGSGENRFNLEAVRALGELLDEVQASDCTALVTTAEGKIWSNGMDAPWAADNPEFAAPTLEATERLLARVLAFPLPTVAALQGHTFAAGLLYALAHDLRVMRADRGFVCLPEVTFGAVFSSGMIDLLTARIAPQVAHRAIVLGHRFDAQEALACGLVDRVEGPSELLGAAVDLAGTVGGEERGAYGAMKRALYADVLVSLGKPPPPVLVEALVARGAR